MIGYVYTDPSIYKYKFHSRSPGERNTTKFIREKLEEFRDSDKCCLIFEFELGGKGEYKNLTTAKFAVDAQLKELGLLYDSIGRVDRVYIFKVGDL